MKDKNKTRAQLISELEETLNQRLQFERLLSELSARFANLPASRMTEEIEHGLQLIIVDYY